MLFFQHIFCIFEEIFIQQMIKKTIIVGDIIGYTDLKDEAKNYLETSINELKEELNQKYQVYLRLIKGDYLEAYVPDNKNGLRVLLLIKTYIKSIVSVQPELFTTNSNRIYLFKKYGIRLALGIADLKRLDLKKGIIDGEAIYLAGRKINQFSTANKKRQSIKETLFILSDDDEISWTLSPMLSLMDFIINSATSKQSKILYYLLNGYSEKEISKILSINQSVINRSSRNSGWNAIEKAVNFYAEFIEKKL